MCLRDRQVWPELGLLQHDADALPERGAGTLGIEAEDIDLTSVAGAVALEDLDRRRLPGAVRAEQAEDLAFLDLEADPAKSLVGPVGLPEVTDGDRAHSASTLAPSVSCCLRQSAGPRAGCDCRRGRPRRS